jgi:hypothetical protein
MTGQSHAGPGRCRPRRTRPDAVCCLRSSRPVRRNGLGRIAQWKSARLTSEGSLVRTQLRPPEKTRSDRMLILIRPIPGFTAGTTGACSGCGKETPRAGNIVVDQQGALH